MSFSLLNVNVVNIVVVFVVADNLTAIHIFVAFIFAFGCTLGPKALKFVLV